MRKEFKYLNDFLYSSYILQIEQEISSNPRRFFSFIDGKRKSVGYPTVKSFGGNLFSRSTAICNAFSNYFVGVFETASAVNYRGCGSLNVLQLTELEVLNGLLNLGSCKSVGPDGIPSIILKNCANLLVEPLTFIFNLSLRIGVFPDIWKMSFVRPVFKSGCKGDITCYRPINILSAAPKLFEMLVKRRLEFILKKDINSLQHGFMQGRSTTSNLVVFSNYLYNVLSQKGQVDVIYTDFSKAFDKLDHGLLLEKTRSY